MSECAFKFCGALGGIALLAVICILAVFGVAYAAELKEWLDGKLGRNKKPPEVQPEPRQMDPIISLIIDLLKSDSESWEFGREVASHPSGTRLQKSPISGWWPTGEASHLYFHEDDLEALSVAVRSLVHRRVERKLREYQKTGK